MSLYQKFIQNERLRRFCVLALIIFCALFIQKYDYNNSFNIYLYLFSCSFGPFCSTLYENPDDCHRSL